MRPCLACASRHGHGMDRRRRHRGDDVAGRPPPAAARFRSRLHRPGLERGDRQPTAPRRRACTAVTCGARGCYYLTADSAAPVRHLPAIAVATVETTGCGDVFHGAYAMALSAGQPEVECLRFAAAAAAAFAARPGGWEHLPALADVNQLLSSTH